MSTSVVCYGCYQGMWTRLEGVLKFNQVLHTFSKRGRCQKDSFLVGCGFFRRSVVRVSRGLPFCN